MSEHITPIVVATLSRAGENLKIQATDQMLVDLAADCGVTTFEQLNAFVKVVPFKRGGAKISGSIKASVSQPCVVTTEPVEQHLELELERSFLSPQEMERRIQIMEEGELILDPENSDEPDEVVDGEIDLWQVLVEELCLAIDLYPRKEGAQIGSEFANSEKPENDGNEEKQRPFSELKALINQKKT